MNFTISPQSPQLHLSQSATSIADLSRTTAKRAIIYKHKCIIIDCYLGFCKIHLLGASINSYAPVVVVDFLQLCDVSQEYTVDLFELVFSVSFGEKLTNLKVELFSDRASSHKVRVINVPCINNK